mgnify:FL=1
MNNESRPHVKPGPIKYTKGYGRNLVISKTINFIIAILTIISIVLVIFVYIAQPVRTENGFIQAELIYKRTPKIGEHVIVVETEDFGMFTPLQRAIMNQNIYEAEIIAGPYGEIKKPNDNFIVIFADQTTTVDLEVDLNNSDEKYLDKEYIVRKIDKEGNYLKEKDEIVNKNEILGLMK